jgi:hypothetical protein
MDTYQSSWMGWRITFWMPYPGTWEYMATRGREYAHGTVEAISEENARTKIVFELLEA